MQCSHCDKFCTCFQILFGKPSLLMSELPYLVALALIEQEGIRAMPLGGKSIRHPITKDSDPGELGQTLAKELLLRVFQRSEDGPLRRVEGDRSLLLIQVQMEAMQESIPLIKAEWIATGNGEAFLEKLEKLCDGVWSLNFTRDNGIQFSTFQ